ncbi:MAG: alpha-amylase family glycosyl hydrolase [Granulicella sp.]
MEFHISRNVRDRYDVSEILFGYAGNVIFGNIGASRELADRINKVRNTEQNPDQAIHAGKLFAMGLIDELSHALIARYRKTLDPQVLSEAIRWFTSQADRARVETLLSSFTRQFPNVAVYREEQTVEEWLAAATEEMPNREAAVEEMLLLWLANINPAFLPFKEFFDDRQLQPGTIYKEVTSHLDDYFATRPAFAPEIGTLLDALRAPMLASPDSLTGQLAYIRDHWVEYLGKELRDLLLAIDILKEEDIAIWMRFHPPSASAHHPEQKKGWGSEGFDGDEFLGFAAGDRGQKHSSSQPTVHEYEAFSQDQEWMPTVVLIAKSTYVWLEQLSKKYQRHIHRLDQIPQEELALLADRGLNGLWLIGLWERSSASQTIKRLRGQADAVASAYSVADYRIAEDLGGEPAYRHLRDQAASVGIRLASDMVPNHMGIDSTWVIEHPEWFLSRPVSPFPVYRFDGPDLSTDSRIEIKIEDHYYDQTDAAVVFRRRERDNGHTSFVYHGNDGTTFAWNDTAQLDYSKAVVREQVMQTILQVARLFPIIRFDAAMTLAKKHVQRLWFPLPGIGGSIPSRAENSMTNEEFDALMPNEFWREVVDRVAVEVPGTLLLAEAFWLLEGYFVRTLGMHRVYNSAFMNMLRDEENAKYRSYLKKTIEFDPDILKRYVNFMSNPDERTAIDQFGSGDRYFGACTLLATLPGLPMFGHGQIEAFTEKYGMEYKQARMDEWPNEDLVARHQREIAPLLKNRQLFAGSSDFFLYDFWTSDGTVDENVFAYSNLCYANRSTPERAIVFFNNRYGGTRGTIHASAQSMDKANGTLRSKQLNDALHLTSDDAVVVACKDAATGLEYLRRSRDIAHHGLGLELRAYQYVVLQDWRELRSTAEQPWDRLCDALNGAGVYNLEEALSKLRLRPVHESLRQLLSPAILQTVIDMAAESPAEEQNAASLPSTGGNSPIEVKKTASKPGQAARTALPANSVGTGNTAANGQDGTRGPRAHQDDDPRLAVLCEKAGRFSTAIEQLEGMRVGNPAEAFETQVATLIRSLMNLPKSAPTIDWSERSKWVLPLGTQNTSLAVWAPVVAWGILRHLNVNVEGNLALFEKLQLRSALAEIFSSLGLEGEDSWRASARVHLLLAHDFEGDGLALDSLLRTRQFWADPDARWLMGISEFEDQTFFNKELFEELACWLLLPDLMKGNASKPVDLEAHLRATLLAAQVAGFDAEKFATLLQSPAKLQKAASDPASVPDPVGAHETKAKLKIVAVKK